MTTWHDGRVARWTRGTMDAWHDGRVARWTRGTMDASHDGRVARWTRGTMDAWPRREAWTRRRQSAATALCRCDARTRRTRLLRKKSRPLRKTRPARSSRPAALSCGLRLRAEGPRAEEGGRGHGYIGMRRCGHMRRCGLIERLLGRQSCGHSSSREGNATRRLPSQKLPSDESASRSACAHPEAHCIALLFQSRWVGAEARMCVDSAPRTDAGEAGDDGGFMERGGGAARGRGVVWARPEQEAARRRLDRRVRDCIGRPLTQHAQNLRAVVKCLRRTHMKTAGAPPSLRDYR
eukprot:6200689-Pleurochrysis_carterae.AAC.1